MANSRTSPSDGPESTATSGGSSKRVRRTVLFPAATFEDALELAREIYTAGGGQPVRRVTLFDQLGKSPDSGKSRQLVTNSTKYGLSLGSYSAEFLELTDDGLAAVSDEASPARQLRARFRCAVANIDVFSKLYESYLNNRLPSQAVLIDKARELGVPEGDALECVETFIVNTKFIGILRSVGGAERLLGVDAVIDDYLPKSDASQGSGVVAPDVRSGSLAVTHPEAQPGDTDSAGYDDACFYISPIGDEHSEARRHADLFMGALVEPALNEFGLRLVRADQIGDAGMITGQIINHIVHSKLVIADLSFHNPNVFYELALRHAVRRPIVQISRLADRLPFDIGQIRTVVVDTTDIYSLVPQLDSLRAQIGAQIRAALEGAEVENPLSIFSPNFWSSMPRS